MKSLSLDIGSLSYRIALKLDGRIDSSVKNFKRSQNSKQKSSDSENLRDKILVKYWNIPHMFQLCSENFLDVAVVVDFGVVVVVIGDVSKNIWYMTEL